MSQKEFKDHRRRGVLFYIALLALLLAPIANFSHAANPAPEISITIPSSHTIGNYTFIHGNVSVDVNITGNFTYADFYLDGQFISQFNQSDNIVNENGTNYTYTTYHYFWDTFYTGEGPHIVKVEAHYPSGEVSLSKTYYVDNHVPVASIQVNNSGILKGVQELNITVKDPFYSISSGIWKVNLYIDNDKVYNHTLTEISSFYAFPYIWDTEKYRDGHHNITVQVWDNAGNEANYIFTYLVDNHPPSVAIISNLYLKGIATLNVSVSDNVSGIGKVQFFIDGNLTYTAYHYPYLFIWNTENYTDGKHLISVIVYDKAGNKNSASVYVIVDNTPPVIKLLSPKPSGNGTLSGNVEIKIKGTDDVTGMASIKLYIDNYFVANGTNSIDYEWNTTRYFNGLHRLTIIASDKIGNVAMYDYNFTIYNRPHPPTLTITSPENNTLFGTNVVKVKWTSTGPLEYYEIKVDNTQYIKTMNESYQVSLADGNHTFYVKAVFKGGKTITKEVMFRIDTTPPEILELLGSYHFIKPGTINFTVKDASPIQVFIYVAQGNQWVLYNQGNSTHWTIKIDKQGNYQFKIVAVDEVQNTQERVIQVSYSIPPPPQREKVRGSPFMHLLLYPMLMLILAIIAVVVLMRQLKKKKRKRESEESLSPKERAVLDEIMAYIGENEGAKRGDVIKDVSNRMGITEDEVGVMLDFAKDHYLVNERVDTDGVIRVYPLEKLQGTLQTEEAPSGEEGGKKKHLLKRR
ncbi:Ig-like domain-containing protein [Candidatus Aciduliprofundum boonei]|uniref:Bacterial Ig-like domain-containing protein n=1 Tax=Aciduliprofundum boonei (strain DSM 19572 / T469) TaxID=439481 RepID=B5IH40_ACIB4|nr:Ig-like domain-containing protein [Candidatus Aciduliprofundum boonei]ADD08875.1 hypothetical protein Aboo_1066 [Aciduliprofundum boonei T469]EDY34411.1 hypothetical protein ABOONEI_954 [Aciduliprofundum boonei T469]HII55626.1 hypothetical protein [Candidatus Aciduliprofundum boonei]